MASPNPTQLATMTTTPHTEDENCSIDMPDYNTLRQQNQKKINDYYNNLLSSYTNDNLDYSKQKLSSNINDRTFAETKLKPKLGDYSTQIVNVSKTLIEKINLETDLIMDQKKTLGQKTTDLDSLKKEVAKLKNKNTKLTTMENSNNDSITQTKNKIGRLEFFNNIYIGTNITLLFIAIYLMFQ